MYHCKICGVCSELHDHHCEVFGVCICANNFKYFFLFMFYGGLTVIAMGLSIKCMLNNCNNKIITKSLQFDYENWDVCCYVVGNVFIYISISFLCDVFPKCNEDDNVDRAHRQLIYHHKYVTGRLDMSDDDISLIAIFLKYYFGSSWNPLWWLMPF